MSPRDAKLSRDVALKVLPAELASPERRKRFEREAKAIAALNHPNIVHVYSVEEVDSTSFITMELVKGKTVAQLLPRNGFPLAKFFEIAIPLTDAVAAAHEQITHRDLKPDNVMESDEGRVKVLDFGLAKVALGFAGWERSSDEDENPGRAIIGTLHYMSPEQATGKAVDHRSDVFSLGVIFYEMLLGRRPFAGDTPAEVLSSVVKDTPGSPLEARPEVPRELSKIVMRCLAKDRARRFQSTLDIRNELEELKADLGSGELPMSAPRATPSKTRNWLLVAACVLLFGLVGLFYLGRTTSDAVPRLVNPVQVTSAVGEEAPDGGRLAYESDGSGNWDIWLTHVGGREAVNLTAEHEGDDRYPSWSPDGRVIAFLSERDGNWGLYTVSALGGRARKVTAALTRPYTGFKGAPQWSSDGREIALVAHDAGSNSAQVVTLETQEVREIALPKHSTNNIFDLSWSRDGSRFAYVDANVSNAEITRLWVVSDSGGEPTSVTDGFTNDWSPTWSQDGQHLFFISNRGGTMDLWRSVVDGAGNPQGDVLGWWAGPTTDKSSR